jgi:flagellar motor switch protein FliG
MGEITFDKLVNLSKNALFDVSRCEDKFILAKALKTADKSVQDAVFNVMSPAAGRILRDIMRYMVFPNAEEIIEARKRICEIAKSWKYWNEPSDEEEDNDNSIL